MNDEQFKAACKHWSSSEHLREAQDLLRLCRKCVQGYRNRTGCDPYAKNQFVRPWYYFAQSPEGKEHDRLATERRAHLRVAGIKNRIDPTK